MIYWKWCGLLGVEDRNYELLIAVKVKNGYNRAIIK